MSVGERSNTENKETTSRFYFCGSGRWLFRKVIDKPHKISCYIVRICAMNDIVTVLEARMLYGSYSGKDIHMLVIVRCRNNTIKHIFSGK